jgi:nitroreductase
VREFKPDPIPDEYVEKMIDAARWAQSGANAQPWEFIVIKGKKTREEVARIYQEYHEQVWQVERTRIKELRHLAYTDGPPAKPPGFKDAPVIIIICGDPRAVQATILATHFIPNEGGPGAHFLKNMANATQILQLAAAALGLGAQWVSISRITETRLKALLNVPEELTIPTIVPVGYPVRKLSPTYRRELKDIIHYEKYDLSKYRSGEDIYQFLLGLRQHTKPAYSMFSKK